MRYDEDDVRIRPGRRSRPRTKDRPAHAQASVGFVVAVDRGRYTCQLDGADIVAMKARELGRKSIVVGDQVALVGDVAGGAGSLARIVRVEPRRSALRRTADDTDSVERVIVANADRMVIVMSLADPEPVPRLIDRSLVAAFDAGIAPLLCLTKSDLAAPERLLGAYQPLGIDIVVLGRTAGDRTLVGLEPLAEALIGEVSAFVGHSGVGKSTIVNALTGTDHRRTAEVSAATGLGRHTSTSAQALRLPGGGWVIDTPGLRSFGLAHVSVQRLLAAFPELAQAAAGCPTDCRHVGADVSECELDEAVRQGVVAPARLASFRRLLDLREAGPGQA